MLRWRRMLRKRKVEKDIEVMEVIWDWESKPPMDQWTNKTKKNQWTTQCTC